jgi:hypothetical protein
MEWMQDGGLAVERAIYDISRQDVNASSNDILWHRLLTFRGIRHCPAGQEDSPP